MSYILEALRRAQAERERQGVPGLQAQPYADLPAPAAPRRRVALASVGGLLAGAALLSALWWWSTAKEPPRAVVEAAPVPMPAPSPQPAPPPPSPPAVTAPPRLPMVVSAPPPASAAASPPASTMAAAPAASAAPAGPRVVRLAQLPADQRRELPPLAVGGSVWSENVSSRFVIVDGQLLREGESLQPGLVLERIAPKAAWMRWRDLRIELAL